MNTRREQIKEGLQDWFKGATPVDTLQNYGDMVGMVPGIGNIVDVGNALVDVVQGDYGDAAVRAAQALPVVGIPAALAGDIIKQKVQDATKSKEKPSAYQEYGQSMFADSEEEEEEDKGKSDPAAGQLAKSMMSNMYNTRMVNWAPMATFGESTEVLSEALPLAKIMKSLTSKKSKSNSKSFGYDTKLLNKRGIFGRLPPSAPLAAGAVGTYGIFTTPEERKPFTDTVSSAGRVVGDGMLGIRDEIRKIFGLPPIEESTEVLSEALPFGKFLKSKKGKVADENRAAATSNVQQADLDDVQRKQRELSRATDEKNKEARKGWFGYDTNKIFNRRGQMLGGAALTTLGIGGTIAIPKIFGGADEVSGGQPLSVGAHSGAAPTHTFDKLQSLSSFVPQYNPASVAMGALSRRVAGQIA
jgi:hypothetical protein